MYWSVLWKKWFQHHIHHIIGAPESIFKKRSIAYLNISLTILYTDPSIIQSHSYILEFVPPLTLVAVAEGPANSTRALPEEAPRVGLSVWVSTEVVIPQATAGVLQHVVWEVCPPQAGEASISLGN